MRAVAQADLLRILTESCRGFRAKIAGDTKRGSVSRKRILISSDQSLQATTRRFIGIAAHLLVKGLRLPRDGPQARHLLQDGLIG
jgi:hypothetical protein